MTARIETKLAETASLDLLEDQDYEDAEDDDEDAGEDEHRFYDSELRYLELRHKRGDMPDIRHSELLFYLVQLLRWLYHLKDYRIGWEFNFYQTNDYYETPLYPDLFLFKHWVDLDKSYYIGKDGPPPELVIEILSDRTRQSDIGDKPTNKPQRYETWGVLEYFSYDPRPRKRKSKTPRLRGWRLVDGHYQPIEVVGKDGRLWSEQLESWLVPDESMMRLYDRDNNLRLTKEEASELRVERMAQRLREMGVDPDKF